MTKNFSISDIEYEQNADAKDVTTMKIPSKLKGIFYPKNQKELIFIYNFLSINDIDFKLIGNGSNLIFSPNCQNLVLISTKKLKEKIQIKNDILNISCGMTLYKIYNFCQKLGLSGFEKLAGIPATLGGAIIMNAGAFGENICDYLLSVKIVENGKIKVLPKEKIEFSYRETSLKNCLVLSAKFRLPHKDKCQIERDFYKYQYLRNTKQPKGLCSGSVFKNPKSFSAGFLIENCLLKGKTIGGAKLSEKHANFILNENNASFCDVVNLINLIKEEVYNKYQIMLEEEIIFV